MKKLLASLPDGDGHLREPSQRESSSRPQQDQMGAASTPRDEDPAILSFTPSDPPRILKRPHPSEEACTEHSELAASPAKQSPELPASAVEAAVAPPEDDTSAEPAGELPSSSGDATSSAMTGSDRTPTPAAAPPPGEDAPAQAQSHVSSPGHHGKLIKFSEFMLYMQSFYL